MTTTTTNDHQPTNATAPVDHSIVVYSDITCPWAHIAVHRVLDARRRLGLDRELAIEHRAFPLELVNEQPTSKELLDAEIPTLRELEPDAGWGDSPQPWTYPVSSLPALEAVQAAKAQGPDQSVALDRALRLAVFDEWRCVSVFPVVLDVARSVEGIDVDQLWDEIRSGRTRAQVFHHLDVVSSGEIPASPTIVLPDGSIHPNPGIEMHWTDGPGSELVVDRDDRDAVAHLAARAAAVPDPGENTGVGDFGTAGTPLT